jgi:hypothetical protein
MEGWIEWDSRIFVSRHLFVSNRIGGEPVKRHHGQSITAAAKLFTVGFVRLLVRRIIGRLYLVCFRRRFRATITGTEDFVTR